MSYFDWDQANLAHIRMHNVEPQEAEEALSLQPFEFDDYPEDGEHRFDTLGPTRTGRILKVVTTQRGLQTRVVTAYDASFYYRKQYLSYLVTL